MNWIHLAQDKKQVSGSCEKDNDLSGSVKCEEFLNQLRE
jgi:hypothetical protein